MLGQLADTDRGKGGGNEETVFNMFVVFQVNI